MESPGGNMSQNTPVGLIPSSPQRGQHHASLPHRGQHHTPSPNRGQHHTSSPHRGQNHSSSSHRGHHHTSRPSHSSSLLEEVLAEKKMALMQSPEVIRYLQAMQGEIQDKHRHVADPETPRELTPDYARNTPLVIMEECSPGSDLGDVTPSTGSYSHYIQSTGSNSHYIQSTGSNSHYIQSTGSNSHYIQSTGSYSHGTLSTGLYSHGTQRPHTGVVRGGVLTVRDSPYTASSNSTTLQTNSVSGRAASLSKANRNTTLAVLAGGCRSTPIIGGSRGTPVTGESTGALITGGFRGAPFTGGSQSSPQYVASQTSSALQPNEPLTGVQCAPPSSVSAGAHFILTSSGSQLPVCPAVRPGAVISVAADNPSSLHSQLSGTNTMCQAPGFTMATQPGIHDDLSRTSFSLVTQWLNANIGIQGQEGISQGVPPSHGDPGEPSIQGTMHQDLAFKSEPQQELFANFYRDNTNKDARD